MKILHVLYSGLGGHGNVFFSMVDANESRQYSFEALFNGTENVKEEYENNIKKYFKSISMTCAQNKIKYVPVNVGADFEKIMTTYLVEKQMFG